MHKLGHRARCLQSLGQSFEMLRSWHDSQVLKRVCKPIRVKRALEASRHWHAPQRLKLWHQWMCELSRSHTCDTQTCDLLFQKSALNPIWFCDRMDERMCKWMDVLCWFLVGKFTRKCFYSMWWKRAFMVARVGHLAFTPCVLQQHYFPAEKWCRRKGDSLLVAVLLTQTCACVTLDADLEPPSFPFC